MAGQANCTFERQSGPPDGGRLEVGGAVLLHLRDTCVTFVTTLVSYVDSVQLHPPKLATSVARREVSTWCAQPWNLEGERRRHTALCKLIL